MIHPMMQRLMQHAMQQRQMGPQMQQGRMGIQPQMQQPSPFGGGGMGHTGIMPGIGGSGMNIGQAMGQMGQATAGMGGPNPISFGQPQQMQQAGAGGGQPMQMAGGGPGPSGGGFEKLMQAAMAARGGNMQKAQ